MKTPIRVLILEDQPTDAELLVRELSRGEFEPTWECVDTDEKFGAALDSNPDVILADFTVPGFGAMGALRRLQQRGLKIPLIVVTGSIQDEAVVDCIKEGAVDYLLKDRLARLGTAVKRALELRREQAETALLEEQLRHAQRLESVGRLAGGVAHDFNNLLTVIMGNASIALNAVRPPDPVRHQLGEIAAAADRAAVLTRQLLVFSRKQALQPTVIQLNDVVPAMMSMLQRLIGEDVELVVRLFPDLPCVRADRGQIEQVIVNLVVNARDAMPKGGKLTIETAPVELDQMYLRSHVSVTPGTYVMLAVTDTGCGMDAATRDRIFEPFFTTKEPGKGTGLGLATVYGIVKQSEGNIWVYSELGRGTSFKIYLPLVRQSADVVPPTPHAVPRRGVETILVAEDEPSVRSLVTTLLSHMGYSVIEAAGGGEALRAAQRHAGPIHLLVSDMMMPDLSGPELREHLRPLRPDMKVLYLSGYTEHSIFKDGNMEPGTSMMQKPFSTDGLLQKIRDILDAPRM